MIMTETQVVLPHWYLVHMQWIVANIAINSHHLQFTNAVYIRPNGNVMWPDHADTHPYRQINDFHIPSVMGICHVCSFVAHSIDGGTKRKPTTTTAEIKITKAKHAWDGMDTSSALIEKFPHTHLNEATT